jgi:hypothetical protein
MEHPFVGDLSHLSMEELTDKINSLNNKLAFASRSMNYSMANQIRMVLESYRSELNKQHQKLLEDDRAITGKIDIS